MERAVVEELDILLHAENGLMGGAKAVIELNLKEDERTWMKMMKGRVHCARFQVTVNVIVAVVKVYQKENFLY